MRMLPLALAVLALAGSTAGASAPGDPCPAEAHVAALRAQLNRIEALGGQLTPEGRAIADGGPLPGGAAAPGESSVGRVLLATNVPAAAMHAAPAC